MEPAYWHQKWTSNQIGFHDDAPNAQLVAHFGRLGLAPGARVLVPLCGKTRDIGWLRAQGVSVVGAELSRLAVTQLFSDLGLEPEVRETGALVRYSGPGIDIHQGDIFDLTPQALGPVDAVYDRAALIALPDDLRARYAAHLATLSGTAPQLLICLEFDPSRYPGPPFPVPQAELDRVHGARYQAHRIATVKVEGGLKGVCPATSVAWHLTPRRP